MSRRDRRPANEMGPFGGCRVYVGDIGRINRTELEREFGQYGPVIDVWMGAKRDSAALNFAFVVFRYPEDAEEAVMDRNGRKVCGRIVRVEHARPAGQRAMRGNFGSDRNFRGPPQRRRSGSWDRYNQRSPSPSRNRRSQASPNDYKERRHKSSPQKKPVSRYTPSPSPEPVQTKPKKSSKTKREASTSPSPSPPPRQSRPKKKQSQVSQSPHSRSSSSQSSSSSASPPPKKKQKKHKKHKIRSPSASPVASDEYDARHYQKKQDGKHKVKSSKHKKKSRAVESESYSSDSD